jgi:hypothetical protein
VRSDADYSTMSLIRAYTVAFLSFLLLAGCGSSRVSSSRGTNAAAYKSSEAARRTLATFFIKVQRAQYEQACAMYTPSVRRLVDREFGGCVRNLAALHALAQHQRTHGTADVLEQSINRVRAAAFSISGNVASTTAVGRTGTITTLLYKAGHWAINRPAT